MLDAAANSQQINHAIDVALPLLNTNDLVNYPE